MDRSWLNKICPVPSPAPPDFTRKSLCGCEEHSRGWVEARRVIYDHELILIESGEFDLECEDRLVKLEALQFFIVPPGVWHSTSCRLPGRRHFLHFDWEWVRVREGSPVMTFFPAHPQTEFLRRAPERIPSGWIEGKIEEPERVFALMDRLRGMLDSRQSHEMIAARGVLLELLLRLLDENPRVQQRVRHSEELAYRVRACLDGMVSTPSGEQAVCAALEALGFSYAHLSRVFRQQYGVTPVGYLHSMRIERAKQLLKQTDLKVFAVASSVGYADSVYFSRLFKRHTGISPARFRSTRASILPEV